MTPIHIFTDGACKGNPGSMGIGIVIIPDLSDPNSVIKIGKYIGRGTNNIAELTAINLALDELNKLNTNRPAVIWSDSQYSINVLTRFKSKANQKLIQQIKSKMLMYSPGLQLKHVLGHRDNMFNNWADKLASDSATKGK